MGRLHRHRSGVGVMPGFYVFADSSGAAVIPGAQLEELIEGARAVEAEDDGYLAEIREERMPPSTKGGAR